MDMKPIPQAMTETPFWLRSQPPDDDAPWAHELDDRPAHDAPFVDGPPPPIGYLIESIERSTESAGEPAAPPESSERLVREREDDGNRYRGLLLFYQGPERGDVEEARKALGDPRHWIHTGRRR